MTKVVFVAFTLLTAAAGYMTVYGIGAEDSSVERSVRERSAGHVFIGGGK
ncbi:MAG: hypothetical protein ACR2QJ_17080 [Geminicoccaceae bacterium]